MSRRRTEAHPRAEARPQPEPDFAREQYLYLITRGRKSGRSREIEIWFTRRGGCFYVIAEYEIWHWLQNVRSHPEVQVRVAGLTFAARARVLSPETDAELQRTIQELSRKKYGWGDGVVVELAPGPDET